MVSVLQVWMRASPQGHIGVFRLCHNICNLGMSNASLHRAIARHQLVAEITPFFYCLRAWDFGRVILPAFVWPISTGSKLGLMFPEKGGVRRDYRLPKKSVMRSQRICYRASRHASAINCLSAPAHPFVSLDLHVR
jgi:hypothetical protein